MPSFQPYCTARIVGSDQNLTETSRTFDDFDAVLAFLLDCYDTYATEIADRRASDPNAETFPLGGFGFDLTNRWTRKVMLGVGTDVWAFWGLKPTKTFTDTPPNSDGLVFFVDGWHYTECDAQWLVSRDRCIEWLRQWLDNNELPLT